jgi:hypothetical protein
LYGPLTWGKEDVCWEVTQKIWFQPGVS